MHEPDPLTVRRAADGDAAAFESLVRAYAAPMQRYLHHLVGDAHAAEELAQEAYLRAYRRLHTFRHDARFSTWLFRIARNAAFDARRGDQRRARREQRAAAAAPAFVPDQAPLGVELNAALAALSRPLRDAMVTVEVLGYGYRDAAEVLGVPEGTVKSRVFTARRQLVAWLHADDAPASAPNEPASPPVHDVAVAAHEER